MRLLGWLLFACLLAWPGLPVQNCAGPHRCCSLEKKSQCGCETPRRPKLCNCKKHLHGETAWAPASPSLELALQVYLVLDFLETRRILPIERPQRPLRRVRGPTELGLQTRHLSLPPPA